MSEKIIIGSARQITGYVRSLPVETEWKWCYFGVDIERKQKIEAIFSRAKRYYYAEELYRLSHDLRGPFMGWIADINAQFKDNLRWWAARLASKSPFQTDFFLLFCYFNLIRGWVINGPLGTGYPLLVIIEDPYLQRLLETEIHQAGIDSVLIKGARFRLMLSIAFYRIKAVLATALFLRRKIIALFLDGYLKIKFFKRLKSIKDYAAEVMVLTFFDRRSFNKGGFADIYKFALIGDIYKKVGRKVIIGSQLDFPYFLKNIILRTKGDYFLPVFYLKIRDWLKVIFMRPIMLSDKKGQILQGSDYHILFFREYLQEASSTSFLVRLCLYYAYRNYFSENRQLKLVIYPFENQPWEKMLLLAMRDANPGIISASYQHSTLSSIEMNHFLSPQEYKFTLCPNYIIANSLHYEEILNSAGFQETKIINGGSIRYAGKTDKDSFIKRRGQPEKNILFILQPPVSRSLELIYCLRNVVSKKYRFNLYVKPRPELFNHKIKKAVRMADKTAIISFSLLDKILRETDLVVYSSTTVALEALNKGIPVYKINTELLDLDILDDLGLKPYKMTQGQEIDLDSVNFNGDTALTPSGIITEPIKEEAWLSLL